MLEWFVLDYGVARGIELPGCGWMASHGRCSVGSVDDRQGTGALVRTTAWTRADSSFHLHAGVPRPIICHFAVEMAKG